MSHSAHPDRQPNRLAHESSPYLQQHAFNPVDWFPWGPEAFEKAKQENKPIFLSIGYSACHWCHVMERESFENEAIAKYLNQHYVSIKVDREERPDVDQIYMSAVQLITQRGGWPMSVFLTPSGQPFYGGTYWPPVSRMGMPGFGDLLVKLNDYWVNKRNEVDSSAAQLVEAIQNMAAPVFERAELNAEILQTAMTALLRSADRREGGFGGAPKFPHPMDLRVLLRCARRFGNDDALQVALLSLTKMAHGGIYDQLGGGFHRYSTDARWLAPHFEKMLYDNALLVPAYLEAWQITRDEEYATVVRETLDYILREMTAPAGGFYATQDADSEGEEGKFFVWSEAEIDQLLDPADARVFKLSYDVTPRGNWEEKTILNRPRPLQLIADQLQLPLNSTADSEGVLQILDRCRTRLLAARSKRIPPGRDDKILVAWNGMMIAACAQAALVLHEPRYLDAARAAARFIIDHMRDPQGRLLHSFKDGQARLNAYLDDSACFIDGLVELFQAESGWQTAENSTAASEWLTVALDLTKDLSVRFADADKGGFFYTPIDHEELIARTKDSQDNATPSGNGMAATALLKLARLTGRDDVEQLAIRTLDALSGLLIDHPRASGQALIALDLALGPTYEVVITADADQSGDKLWDTLWQQFVPNKVAVRWPTGLAVPEVLQDLLAGKTERGPSAAFLCQRGACQTPVETPDALIAALSKAR
ncbi:thioredoxin domain-containing protein [Planctomicrobium sp. SH664]|uniref:thioredoxin domain-containing protein n=1 Tax=Planctomicrobium sp. SH664 TaxID=3448125 RepID=UPI003F5B14D4